MGEYTLICMASWQMWSWQTSTFQVCGTLHPWESLLGASHWVSDEPVRLVCAWGIGKCTCAPCSCGKNKSCEFPHAPSSTLTSFICGTVLSAGSHCWLDAWACRAGGAGWKMAVLMSCVCSWERHQHCLTAFRIPAAPCHPICFLLRLALVVAHEFK